MRGRRPGQRQQERCQDERGTLNEERGTGAAHQCAATIPVLPAGDSSLNPVTNQIVTTNANTSGKIQNVCHCCKRGRPAGPVTIALEDQARRQRCRTADRSRSVAARTAPAPARESPATPSGRCRSARRRRRSRSRVRAGKCRESTSTSMASTAPSENKRIAHDPRAHAGSSTPLTPSRRKNHGSVSRKSTSDIWPNVIWNAGFGDARIAQEQRHVREVRGQRDAGQHHAQDERR